MTALYCKNIKAHVSQDYDLSLHFILFFLIFPIILSFSNVALSEAPCAGRQWKDPSERLECLYPNPPIGRWKAVYTEEFAGVHNLPPENISSDLSSGVDYMEMDVQPYGNGGTACLVNMLIRKPHDVAFYNKSNHYFSWGPKFHERRKLAHFIDLEDHKEKLKDITTFGRAPRDFRYDPKVAMSSGSAWAFYAENVLEGYDYVTADAGCYQIISNKHLFPSGLAFWVAKASVMGRYETQYKYLEDPSRPKGKDFYDAHLFIKIPEELISTVFKEMPIGGRK